MEIMAIETKTFEQMRQAFKDFTHQVKELCGKDRNNKQWLNNKDVCELLQISQRTLQSYRDNGILPYSQIGHKCYYRVSDIEQFIHKQQIKSERQ
jgi:prophage antirepressor-like protein